MYTSLEHAKHSAQIKANEEKTTVYVGKRRANEYAVTTDAPASFRWKKAKLEFICFVRPAVGA